MSKPKITQDKNGQYFFDGNKMLVHFTRGGMVTKENPRYWDGKKVNRFEPELIKNYWPGLVGCVVAVRVEDEVRFGYSRVNLDVERFNKKRAIEIALGRALYNDVKYPFDEYRMEIWEDLHDMFRHASNYFKFLNKP